MLERKITNCGDCAYVKKEQKGMWCPFHDEPVSNRNVCDYFLDEYDSPQFVALANGMSNEQLATVDKSNFTAKDIFALIITGILLFLGILLLMIPEHYLHIKWF